MSDIHPQDILTERELEVVRLMANGLTNREIGEKLFIGVETVRWYAKQIYSKLGVHSRKEAIQRAIELGLSSDGHTPKPIELNYNIPAQTTPFIGREKEISDVMDLIADPDVRLVTILAPGGMGKTRLSLEIADQIVVGEGLKPSPTKISFSDGVFFVSMAPLAGSGNIVPAIAEAVGYPFQSDNRKPKQQILDFLREKLLLLILDNFEHLLDGASFLTEILETAPGVQILVTSRERLNLRNEAVYALGGLQFPEIDALQELLDYDAIQLFMQGASLVRTDFDLMQEDATHLARICALTEGMPLALVLAAAWVDVLSLEEIAEEISRSFSFLEAEMRDVPRRQWSIRAVFEPTWQRLSEKEQSVFMRLSVFRGGCTRDAAEIVAGADLRTLQSLINKALLQRSADRRYQIHELLRQYAEANLIASDEAGGVHELHSQHFTQFMQEREIDIRGRDQLAGLNAVEADFDNVRAAWQWALRTKNYENLDRILEGVKLFCEMRNRYAERHELFVEVRQQLFPDPGEQPHPLWCRMMVRHAGFMQHQGDVRPDFEKCLEIAQHREDIDEIAYSYYALADAHATIYDAENALKFYEQSLALYQEVDDKFYTTQILNRIGSVYMFMGDIETARNYGNRSFEVGNLIGDLVDAAWALHTVSSYYMFKGHVSEGAKLFEKTKPIWEEFNNQEGLATALLNIAAYYLTIPDLDKTRELLDEALAIAKNINNLMRVGCVYAVLSQVHSQEGNYVKALELAKQAEPLLARMPPLKAFNYSSINVALLGLEEYTMARQNIVESIHYLRKVNPHALIFIPAYTAFIYVHDNRNLEAVELLGLCRPRRQEMGYLVVWSLFIELNERLKAELGEKAYDAALERGKSLDLETVVQAILEEFESDNE